MKSSQAQTYLWMVCLSALMAVAPMAKAQVVAYVHTDALGSPVAITNQAGQVIERTDYEPYGNVIGKVNDDRAGYTGHVMDSVTGLTYMQQRYYDPTIGRMMSRDPVTAYEKPLTNFNAYAYALNSPYKFADPDGRQVRTPSPIDNWEDRVGRQNRCQSSGCRFALAEGNSKQKDAKTTKGTTGSRLLKSIKLDVAPALGIGLGLKVGKAKLGANAHVAMGVSAGGKNGLEGFAERELYAGAELGRARATIGFDSVRYGGASEPIRERKNALEYGRGSADSDGIIGFETTIFVVRVKLQVDMGGVLFAFFGEKNGWEQDGIP